MLSYSLTSKKLSKSFNNLDVDNKHALYKRWENMLYGIRYKHILKEKLQQ